MNTELVVYKLWNMVDDHLIRQQRRGKKFDPHLSFISCRELRFARKFDVRQLQNA